MVAEGVFLLLPASCDGSDLTCEAPLMQAAEAGDGGRVIKYKGAERNSCPSKCRRREIILPRNKWTDYQNMWAYA